MSGKTIILFVAVGLGLATTALAQQAPARWRPNPETVIVRGIADAKKVQAMMTGTLFSEAYLVSASVAVPYSDLNLTRDADASEFDRRIRLAAHLVCRELDIKYPQSRYPTLGDDNCEKDATKDGLTQAEQAIAVARK